LCEQPKEKKAPESSFIRFTGAVRTVCSALYPNTPPPPHGPAGGAPVGEAENRAGAQRPLPTCAMAACMAARRRAWAGTGAWRRGGAPRAAGGGPRGTGRNTVRYTLKKSGFTHAPRTPPKYLPAHMPHIPAHRSYPHARTHSRGQPHTHTVPLNTPCTHQKRRKDNMISAQWSLPVAGEGSSLRPPD